ncbi:low affinity immunoglobulin gamma Fc region receptor II-like [Larimichthys crocea]|uniref:low affinity immunoglobulin gamma Fc region receptor II-like n=1 Tax=Larimichthys crocea TaxID=215358 RepID=UPI000F5F9809|nr:low affinity immunoglobulin gamma Fc region receptor II-like [Larimichthys crocea]
MEVTALCIRLLLNVLMLLLEEQVQLSFAQQAYAAWIVPTRLQLFDYSPITFNCEGFNTTTGWRVMRNKKGKVSMCFSNWETATPSICAIKTVYPTDSGEYWCETVDGEKSNTVNITVTAGPVILESPAVPVMEGKAVTLHCRSKISSVYIADFYKDGFLIGTGPVGELTISSVSKSNEGLYKCRISDFGESPESWLAVRALHRETWTTSSGRSCHIYVILRTVFTILMVALLLLLLGLLHCGKLTVTVM